LDCRERSQLSKVRLGQISSYFFLNSERLPSDPTPRVSFLRKAYGGKSRTSKLVERIPDRITKGIYNLLEVFGLRVVGNKL
jgi:hypothetical protein